MKRVIMYTIGRKRRWDEEDVGPRREERGDGKVCAVP